MAIYVGIDGTGPEWLNPDPQYEKDYWNSHVNYLSRNWVSRDTFYNRGPLIPGLESAALAKLAYDETIKRVNKYGEETPIVLAGHSRGGACVIDAAKYLKKRDKLNVEILILFDAVDKSVGSGGIGGVFDTPISDNVKNVVRATRDPNANSRGTFGNCGTMFEDRSKTFLIPKLFFGTHSAIGGVPAKIPKGASKKDLIDEGFPDGLTYVSYERDRAASRAVRVWMWNHVSSLLVDAEKRRRTPEIGIPTQIPGNPDYISSLPTKNGQRIHVVQPGDWLSKIAQTYYGDMNKWEIIYKFPPNLKEIGPNPDLIKPGQKLIIP